MDESHKHNVERIKTHTKMYILHDYIHIKFKTSKTNWYCLEVHIKMGTSIWNINLESQESSHLCSREDMNEKGLLGSGDILFFLT